MLFRKAQLRKKPSGFQELATQRGANYALACSPKINLPPAETLSGPHKQNTRRINLRVFFHMICQPRKSNDFRSLAGSGIHHGNRCVVHAVGETPFIVVPGNNADQLAVNNLGEIAVKA